MTAIASGNRGMDRTPLPPGLRAAWDEFLHRDIPDPERAIDAVFRHPILFPLQRRREMDRMFEYAARLRPQVYFEIGADKCGGVYAWLKRFPDIRQTIVCEVRGCPAADAFRNAFPQVDFLFLEGSSYSPDTAQRVADWLGTRAVDCLFIDGNKEATWDDFSLYRDRVARPGMVFIHDIKDVKPGAAFERVRMMSRYACDEIDDVTESIDAMERRGMGKAAETEHENWLRQWGGLSCGVGVVQMLRAR